MSKKKHKKRQKEYEEKNYSNNMNNQCNQCNQCNNFNNSPLAQISRMMGNIDMNTLAQMLANFNIKDDVLNNMNDPSMNIKREDNNLDNEEENEEENIEVINENEEMVEPSFKNYEKNNKEQNVMLLLETLKNLCDNETKEEIQKVIDIYSSKSYL